MSLPSCVEQAGTAATEPTYVYDLARLRARLAAVAAMPWAAKRIFFATMANDHPAVLETVRRAGNGVFVNSLRHLDLALTTGFRPADIVYAASNMTDGELSRCLAAGVHIVLDAPCQLEAFCRLAPRGGAVGLRVNVGSALDRRSLRDDPEYRFGLLPEELAEAVVLAAAHDVRIVGVHAYFGTDIMDPALLIAGLERLCEAARILPHLTYVDGGGGLGAPDELGRSEFDLAAYGAGAAAVLARAEQNQQRQLTWFVEPGRYLCADSGWFFARAVGAKYRKDRLLVGLDASVVQLPRLLLHPGVARHPWQVIGREDAPPADLPVWLCGNSTYSRDFLARGDRAVAPRPGDRVVFHQAGAYCRSMFSDFLGKARPPEIVVDSEAVTAARPTPAATTIAA